MIELGCIRDVKVAEYDKVYAIVRSMRHKVEGVQQVSELSPTLGLMNTYLQLRYEGHWNKASFDEVYVPQFITEMKHSKQSRDWLNRLYLEDKRGLKLCLVCFCDDETLCHRSIVGGLLKAVGANVKCKAEYIKYFDMYKEV